MAGLTLARKATEKGEDAVEGFVFGFVVTASIIVLSMWISAKLNVNEHLREEYEATLGEKTRNLNKRMDKLAQRIADLEEGMKGIGIKMAKTAQVLASQPTQNENDEQFDEEK